jgi:hypothetical protein
MKFLYCCLCSLVLLGFDGVNQKTVYFANGNLKASCDVHHDLLNGKFVSYYSNGVKQAEGAFVNNQRTGSWILWDSLGNIRMEREYEYNYAFTITSAKTINGADTVIPFTNYYAYSNNQNQFNYPEISQSDIVVYKDVFRYITSGDENNNKLYLPTITTFVNEFIQQRSAIIFSDAAFNDTINVQKFGQVLNAKNNSVVGYIIKEGWNYNNKYRLAESRFVGLCPVIYNADSKKEIALGWIRVEDCLEDMDLAKMQTTDGQTISLKTYFLSHYFASGIIEEADAYSGKLTSLFKSNKSQEVFFSREIELLDIEHRNWLKSTEVLK